MSSLPGVTVGWEARSEEVIRNKTLVVLQTIEYQASKIIIHDCSKWFLRLGTCVLGTHPPNALTHLRQQWWEILSGLHNWRHGSSAGEPQTMVIRLWVTSWVCRLVQSTVQFLGSRTQLITVLSSFRECGLDILIQWGEGQLRTLLHFRYQESPGGLAYG